MARTAIISPNPASRVWQGRFGPRSPSIHAPRVKCLPPKVSSAADFSQHDPEKWEPVFRSDHAQTKGQSGMTSHPDRARRVTMPVYTVHAPVANGADLAATDKFTFVRDGFHFWAAVFSVLWLIWHRLWLALLGWIVVTAALGIGLAQLGAGRGAIMLSNMLIAILMGFQATSPPRWTVSRRKWRPLA